MIYPGQPVPDLLPLEPPENIGRLREGPDYDELYEQWRERWIEELYAYAEEQTK